MIRPATRTPAIVLRMVVRSLIARDVSRTGALQMVWVTFFASYVYASIISDIASVMEAREKKKKKKKKKKGGGAPPRGGAPSPD